MLSHRSASRLSSAIVLRPTTSRILTLSPSSTSTSTSTSTLTSASTSALFSRYLTTLLPHAHRPLLLSTSSSQRRHLSVWNILERGKNAGLRNVEKQANQHPSEAHLQALLYRAWNGANQHHHVVTRYESGRVAHDDTCYREYVKAMSALGRLQHLKVPTTTSTSQQQPYIQPSSQPVYYPPPQTYQPDLSQHLYGQPTYQQQSYPSQTYGQPSYASAYQHPHQHTQHTQYASSTPTSSGGLTPEAPLYVCQVPETGGSVAKSVVSKLIGGFLSTALIVAFFIALGPIIKSTMTGSSPKEIKPDTDIQHTFADVKGCDEAKHELEEIVQFLKNPQLFTRLGGKLPKGVLLMGPPGTGKTLLAKAIAGEAGVPFFYCAGSEFEEMYVGVGAARIRTLFAAAKKKAPCIVFIDEIDAVGGQRGQRDMSAMRMTLNQLLTEMDGFQENSGVIVIGATNLTQLLDKALVRPGRFDKHVVVPLPDVKGRKQILDLYASKVKIAPDVDTSVIARSTPGCTGADLFNLINSAALRAAASSKNVITMKDLEYAKDKILMGAERVSQVMTLEARKLTAYHEGGHAIMALHTKGAHPLYKATIMPRGQALGMVHQLPETDVYTMSKQQMLAQMDVCMGGRVAEEMIFGPEQVTSGASSDLEKATSIAKSMVTKYGMSDKVGPISYSDKELSTLSATMKKTIDDEINTLLESSRQRAVTLLQTHHGELESLAQALLKYETLDRAEIERILKGLPLQEADQVLTQPVVSHVPSSTPGPVKPLLPIPNNACDGITENQTAAEQQ